MSATDLANHLSCKHLTALDLRAAHKLLTKPTRIDERAKRLAELGIAHEKNYIDFLRGSGLSVSEWHGAADSNPTLEWTIDAMRSGVDVIVQARLQDDRWAGYADILLKNSTPSELGDWSYEVIDTKLSSNTKGGTILQLCLYSDILMILQGIRPQYMHVVSPSEAFIRETFRFDDYSAYYRFVRKQLEQSVSATPEAEIADTYPYPVSHCDVCRWWPICDKQRRHDDHLSFVANCGRTQIRELEANGFKSLEALAVVADRSLPASDTNLPFKPERGSSSTYTGLQRQARLQLDQRESGRPTWEFREDESSNLPGDEFQTESFFGLERLPEPNSGDVFFDIEGDRFAGDHGLEYLFGYSVAADDLSGSSPAQGKTYNYCALWAFEPGSNNVDEKHLFESFIDFITERRKRFPGMHIYHYNHYEPTNLKRLMGLYATRENEIDELLRAGVFVDLYTIVRQSIRAGVESYSIKNLEQYYDYAREVDLREDASPSLRLLEKALQTNQLHLIDPETRQAVEGYNRDDCMSTAHLRDWLERLRQQRIDEGIRIDRPQARSGKPSEKIDDKLRASREVSDALVSGLPENQDDWVDTHRQRWLLAHLLGWHRREAQVTAWEYHRLRDLSEDELFDERSAIGGLRYERPIDLNERLYEYSFPRQEVKLKPDDKLKPGTMVWLAGDTNLDKDGNERELSLPDIGSVHSIDSILGRIVIKKTKKYCDHHPTSIFADSSFYANVQEAALLRFGKFVASNLSGTSFDVPESSSRIWLAAARLLARHFPSELLNEAASLPTSLERALFVAERLDGDVLSIQGPPGSGKTYTGARMICDLVRRGKTVGISANSHKVIRNLLDEVIAESEKQGLDFECLHKTKKLTPKADRDPRIMETKSNEDVSAVMASGTARVFGGTSYLWAREEFAASVDVLIVDEAGQMSLANVLAISQAGDSLVLLGDPAQLDQPTKATQPEGTGVSALEYVLEGHKVMPNDRGLFIPETRRLHPSICRLTSELFYEGQLSPMDGLERQRINNAEFVSGAGLYFVPVDHSGNRNESIEEAYRVRDLVTSLLSGATWTNQDNVDSRLTLDDILVVTPYNAQVTTLQSILPEGANVGTVDKFQGQEAPVVIYSLASSTAEEAPRGMDFLYSLNRLNVATSRARCACVLVANPALIQPECRTPKQIRLANALARYAEMAHVVGDS